jgi:hypothetical protein
VPPSWVLYLVFLAVMGAALGCFLRAFAMRKTTPIHKRWGVTGVLLDLFGTAVVLVLHRGFGWSMAPRDRTLVLWHRGFAYVASAMVLFVAFTGWRRIPIHKRLWPVFLPLYATTLGLAIAAYWPF